MHLSRPRITITNCQHLCFFRDEFAYAASDKLVYIRQFSDKASNMKLTGILQGHEADVTQVYVCLFLKRNILILCLLLSVHVSNAPCMIAEPEYHLTSLCMAKLLHYCHYRHYFFVSYVRQKEMDLRAFIDRILQPALNVRSCTK